MLLTIIPIDGNVIKDNVGHSKLDLLSCSIPSNIRALQWQETSGWLEFWDQQNEDITVLPSWVDCCLSKWTEANMPVSRSLNTAEQNKETAISKLNATDWTTASDVADPTKSNPYLSNVNDFIIYRNNIRQYALNPVEGAITWPKKPKEVWIAV